MHSQTIKPEPTRKRLPVPKPKYPLINALLRPFGAEAVPLATRQDEIDRKQQLEHLGYLEKAPYALPPGLAGFDIQPFVQLLETYGDDLARLHAPDSNDTGFDPKNGYFGSPDADALYLLIRDNKPRRVIEVGCGNSTKVTRQAVIDGQLDTTITAIDPMPRADIAHLVDRFEQTHLENLPDSLFDQLETGDVVFIDSSHQVRLANDVAHLFCRIIPRLAPGVIIHVHDVFLPYEYPKRFYYDCPSWGEQYVLHALLQSGGYEILWPGYYLQRAHPAAERRLPFLKNGRAQSFWIRKL